MCADVPKACRPGRMGYAPKFVAVVVVVLVTSFGGEGAGPLKNFGGVDGRARSSMHPTY